MARSIVVVLVLAAAAGDVSSFSAMKGPESRSASGTSRAKATSVIIANENGKKIITKDGELALSAPDLRIFNGRIQSTNDPKARQESPESVSPSDKVKATADSSSTTVTEVTSGEDDPVRLVDPGLDARQEIANYNRFMDEIFERINRAIRAKNLDPMELKLMQKAQKKPLFRDHLFVDPSAKPAMPATKSSTAATTPSTTTATTTTTSTTESILILTPPASLFASPRPPPVAAVEAEEEEETEEAMKPVRKVQGWLYGMSTLKRSGDVTIFIREDHRTVQCPFSLGPLELKVSKTVGSGESKRTKSAKATTDLMLGLMNLRIDHPDPHNSANDSSQGKAEISEVIFDRPGGVMLNGSLKRNNDFVGGQDNEDKKDALPYKLVLASKAVQGLKKVARLVLAKPIDTTRNVNRRSH